MSLKKLPRSVATILTVVFVLVLGFSVYSVLDIQVSPAALPENADDLPPRPTPNLPGRPTPNFTPMPATPAPEATSTVKASRSTGRNFVQGAYIKLILSENSPLHWTVVEWRDTRDRWQMVEGWQGRVDDSNSTEKIWWVAPEDFSTGPFRWKVYEKKGGDLLSTSSSFYLPANAGHSLSIYVDLSPEGTVNFAPTPTPVPERVVRPAPVTEGGQIVLHVDGAQSPKLWSAVQWQKPDDDTWHDVAGWRGRVDFESKQVIWWVDPSDFETGPFRWVLYDKNGGDILNISDPFSLPAGHGQAVWTLLESNEE